MANPTCTPDCHLNPAREAGAPLPASENFPQASTWLSGGGAVVESDGRIVTANDALAVWLSSSPSGLQGKSLPALLGRRSPQWEESLRRLLGQAAAFDRIELSSANGKVEKLAIESARHGGAHFLRLESATPSIAELDEMFPESCWARVISNGVFQRMLRSETQVQNLMNRWPGIIFSQRPDFSFVFVSPKIEELTGVPASEWRRQSRYFWEVVHEADAEAVAARLRAEAQTGAGLTSTYRIRHTQTGRVTYLWEHRQAVRSSNGLLLGFEGIWLDITRQTIAERRLLSMSWRENLATLTLGLAHDFCNVMTGIVGLSETFEASLEKDNSLRQRAGPDSHDRDAGQPTGPSHPPTAPGLARRKELPRPQRAADLPGRGAREGAASPHPGAHRSGIGPASHLRGCRPTAAGHRQPGAQCRRRNA